MKKKRNTKHHSFVHFFLHCKLFIYVFYMFYLYVLCFTGKNQIQAKEYRCHIRNLRHIIIKDPSLEIETYHYHC